MLFPHFLDDDGLLRLGERLNKAPLNYSAKHPLILHSRNAITRLLIENANNDCVHRGGKHAKAHMQPIFMMIRLRNVPRSLRKYCLSCKRWMADNLRPEMTGLLEFRIQSKQQCPFVKTAIEILGPFYIEDKKLVAQMHNVCLSRAGSPELSIAKKIIGTNKAMKLKFTKNYQPDNEPDIILQLAQQNNQ